jgi:peroxiredoxin
VLLIFYLGSGILHCVEQIQAFVPRAKDFAAAGITVLAISTEDAETLRKALKNFGEEISISSAV